VRIVVNPKKCAGLGMCEAEAPDLFEVQSDGSLVILQDRPSKDQRAEAEAASESCPAGALSIVED
jgi:ferredoxin